MRKQQSGVMLLEALIAILIFSLGILGVVGMQASAVRANRDAKFRSDASLLANELVGEMWASNRNSAALQGNFQGDGPGATHPLADGPGYAAWVARVNAALPGAAAFPPAVLVTPAVPGPGSQVSITVQWMPSNEARPHTYFIVMDII